MAVFILLAVFILTALYLSRRKYLSDASTNRNNAYAVPGPKPLPIIGNAVEFGISPDGMFESMNRLTKNYGSITRFWAGPQLVFFIADPAYLEPVLGNMKKVTVSSFFNVAKPWLGRGLLVTGDEVWRIHRKIITPTLGGQHLAHYLDVFNSNLDILVDKFSLHQNGPSFDVFPLMSLFTLDVICEATMGVKVNTMVDNDSEYFKAVNCLEDAMFKRAFLPWLRPDIVFNITSLGRKQAKYLPVILGLTKRVIQERKQHLFEEMKLEKEENDADVEELGNGKKKGKTFLDHLLLKQAEKGTVLSDQDIEDEVNTVMGAGHDTTAAALTFIWWLLAKYPDVQDKLVEELQMVFGDSLRHATLQDLSELKYMDQVVKECFRILPAAVLLGRRLTEDVVIDNYVLPAGSEVCINLYMLHRHPHHFPDPERFDPDRFSSENCAKRHPYAYIPFSAGPKMCAGYRVGMIKLKATMARLLRHFRFLPPENPFQDLDLTVRLIVKSKNGVPIRIEPRKLFWQ